MPKPAKRSARKPTIMFLLQCQWFRDPDRARQVLATYVTFEGEEEGWNRFVRDMLFMGCLTGRRIREAFGDVLCEDACGYGETPVTTVFEETSREMGGRSGAAFPPDPDHLTASLRLHRPDIVVAFGRVASEALALPEVKAEMEAQPQTIDVVHTGHPAGRGPNVMNGLREAAEIVRDWIKGRT